jgi:hypothetical protein
VIPANLITAIYTTASILSFFLSFINIDVLFHQAIRTGGRDEYNAIMKIQENPKNPAQRLACMFVPPSALTKTC